MAELRNVLDVGGGAVRNGEPHSLAHISLRWMIRQCYLANTGIVFLHDKLFDIGLDPEILEPDVLDRLTQEPLSIELLRAAVRRKDADSLYAEAIESGEDPLLIAQLKENYRDLVDVLSPIHDALREQRAWWLLEVTRGWHREHGHFV